MAELDQIVQRLVERVDERRIALRQPIQLLQPLLVALQLMAELPVGADFILEIEIHGVVRIRHSWPSKIGWVTLETR